MRELWLGHDQGTVASDVVDGKVAGGGLDGQRVAQGGGQGGREDDHLRTVAAQGFRQRPAVTAVEEQVADRQRALRQAVGSTQGAAQAGHTPGTALGHAALKVQRSVTAIGPDIAGLGQGVVGPIGAAHGGEGGTVGTAGGRVGGPHEGCAGRGQKMDGGISHS